MGSRRHVRVRRPARRRRTQTAVSRAAVTALLLGLCGVVTAIGLVTARPFGLGRGRWPGAGEWSLLPVSAHGRGEVVVSLDIDITDDPGDEIATSRKTATNDGYIELNARSKGGAYKLLARVDSGPVTELSQIKLGDCAESSPQSQARPSQKAPIPIWASLLLAHADYDQSIGAMSKSRVSTAYAWDGSNLIDVWSATTGSEAVWNLGWGQAGQVAMNSWTWGATRTRTLSAPWTDVGATAQGGERLGPGDWVRVISSMRVEFVCGAGTVTTVAVRPGTPYVAARSVQEYQSYNDADGSFTTLSSRQVAQVFCWSDRWRAFILSEATVGRDGALGMDYPGAADGFRIPAGTDVAILESERQCPEGLVFSAPFLCKVKLPDGRRCYVREDDLLTSSVHSMV